MLTLSNQGIDPTKTVALRSRYQREMKRRFDAFKKAVDVHIRDRNALQVNAPANKLRAFQLWLKQAERQGLLTRWQNNYLLSAYQKGLAGAGSELGRAGARITDDFIHSAWFRPIHRDRIELIYTRAYTELDGITTVMDTQISRTLAQGLLEGRSADELADAVAENIDGISATRAQVLARTEVIRAHASGTLGAYREARIEGVHLKAEFSTAGDGHVCFKCAALEGNVYDIDAAEGVIPVHPNCRCVWLPVVMDASGVVL